MSTFALSDICLNAYGAHLSLLAAHTDAYAACWGRKISYPLRSTQVFSVRHTTSSAFFLHVRFCCLCNTIKHSLAQIRQGSNWLIKFSNTKFRKGFLDVSNGQINENLFCLFYFSLLKTKCTFRLLKRNALSIF